MEYKEIAEKLWGLLDDISTADDVIRPEDTPFYRYVMERVGKRGEYMYSPDGYKLVVTEELPPTSKET